MSPYEQMVSATERIQALKERGAVAPCDIGVTFFWRGSVIVAKGEAIDADTEARLQSFWQFLAYGYFE